MTDATTAPKTQPDFFLVGAAKSGTTSLAKHLDTHPDVFVSKPKEPNFFAFPSNSEPTCIGPASEAFLFEKLLKFSVTSPAEYDQLFAAAMPRQRTGDASVRYLYEPSAATRIAEHAPDSKAIILLRDPVARMHSHYHMNVRNGLEPLPFTEALQAEDDRVEADWGWDWHYRRVGRYAEQIERYFDCFKNRRVLVLFHSDLQTDPLTLWETVCRFLDVDPTPRPDLGHRAFVGATPRSRWLRDLLWQDSPMKRFARALVPRGVRRLVTRRVNDANVGRVPPLDPAFTAELRDGFRDENARLASLLGRQLPW